MFLFLSPIHMRAHTGPFNWQLNSAWEEVLCQGQDGSRPILCTVCKYNTKRNGAWKERRGFRQGSHMPSKGPLGTTQDQEDDQVVARHRTPLGPVWNTFRIIQCNLIMLQQAKSAIILTPEQTKDCIWFIESSHIILSKCYQHKPWGMILLELGQNIDDKHCEATHFHIAGERIDNHFVSRHAQQCN